MYIPAVPLTLANASHLVEHKAHFLQGLPPPDFPQGPGEGSFVDRGVESNIPEGEGKRAMGFEKFNVPEGASVGEKEVIGSANEILGF